MADETNTPEEQTGTPEQVPAESAPADTPKAEATAPEPAKKPKAKPKAKAKAEEAAPGAADAPAPDAAEAPAPKPEPEPEPKTSVPAPPLPEGVHYIWGTGRRKAAVARVRIRPGTGKILINKRAKDEFFVHHKDRSTVMAPLAAADMETSWDVFVNVKGGGSTGQAGAVMLGLARALAKAVPDTEHTLRDKGLLTRDARMVERKKYGQKGARKRFQFSKR